jgi:Na+/melibiose symporter-like transporter
VNTAALAAYGALRAPLALLELPLFVLLPAYYADRLGLSLVAVGSILFAARALDAVADPAIGAALDRTRDPRDWRRVIWLALPVLILAYGGLFFPPAAVPAGLWLALLSVMTYLAWSVISIAYQTWGARLGGTDAERVRITSWREGFGLLGVLGSAALLVPDRVPALVALFAAAAALAGVMLARAPLPPHRAPATRGSAWGGFLELARHRGVRWTLGIFLVNGIASAIPATLLLFFVGDVLRQPDLTPQFLLTYFVAAAVGLPLWNQLASRWGLKQAWLTGMALSILAFVWAWRLGEGDVAAFFVVCTATGLALGADLSIPPALMARALAQPDAPRARDASAFGLWNLATKLNLAAAAGLALPTLGLLGYAPGQAPASTASPSEALSGTSALALMYALVPCALKLLAALLLLRAPLSPLTRTTP